LCVEIGRGLGADGKLGEGWDANAGLRDPCPKIEPKKIWAKVGIHFGSGFSKRYKTREANLYHWMKQRG
jgi:hypothetical protein